ncbi:solute carrier family 2, facilitated glucose transporter member 11 isoform X12 [Odocoileus virginianus]|uniref:Solute carrier family 2, facilitated glucose transporter member 11 isoform X12 n=1 Tax=Odocoileus virginianus TaxID=9874 RepID=A0ABM4IV99_ODOVR
MWPSTFSNSPMRRGRCEPASRCPTTWSCSCGPSSCPCIPSGASWERCSLGPWPSRWEEVPAGEQHLRAGRRGPVWLQPQSRLLRDDHAGKTARGHQRRELLGGPQAWPLLLASCLVPGALQLASLPLLPESPRYLLIDCGDPAACQAALQRLRGPADLAGELAELEQERAVCRGGRARRPWELFRERALRRQVASLVVLGGAMELCGNDAMYAYALAVFSQAGISQDKIQYVAIGTGGCELLATLLSCLVIERAGRRVLLTGGYGLMTCWGSVFTVALCLQQGSFSWMPYLAMACVFASILSFGIGPAGVTGILATELFDQMARPAAYMVCGALMWTMLFLVGLAFPFIMRQELRGDLGGAAETQLPREGPRPGVGWPRGRQVHGAVARWRGGCQPQARPLLWGPWVCRPGAQPQRDGFGGLLAPLSGGRWQETNKNIDSEKHSGRKYSLGSL